MRPGTGHRGKSIAGPHVALESSNPKNLIRGYGFFKKSPVARLHQYRPAFISIGKWGLAPSPQKQRPPHAMGVLN